MDVHNFAVDDAFNLYIVGQTEQGGTGAVAKFDRAGRKCWDCAYEVTGADNAIALSIVLDGRGNLCAAGSAVADDSDEPDTGVCLVKYSSDGQVAWQALHKEQGHSTELIDAKILGDSSVCVIVDYVSSSLDPADLRARDYSFGAVVYDGGRKVRQDALAALPLSAAMGVSNLCVAEWELDGDRLTHSIVEIDANGNRAVLKTLSNKLDWWVDGQVGELIPQIIAADREGNFYISGVGRPARRSEVETVTCMFSHRGDPLWKHVSRRMPARTEIDLCRPEGLAVDGEGNAYIADWFHDLPSPATYESNWREAVLGLTVNRLRVSKVSRWGDNKWNYEHKLTEGDVMLVGPALLQVQRSGEIVHTYVVEIGLKRHLYVVVLAPDGKEVFAGAVRGASDWAGVYKASESAEGGKGEYRVSNSG